MGPLMITHYTRNVNNNNNDNGTKKNPENHVFTTPSGGEENTCYSDGSARDLGGLT